MFGVLLAALLLHVSFAYIEYVEVSNCENCMLLLTCRHLHSVIAVFNASFAPLDDNSTYYTDFERFLPPVHPRLAVNQRCSGVNHCSFILTADCPGADRWGPGNFTINYACVSERRMTKYCNDNITLPAPEVIGVSEGFIRNPGYPKYYLGRQECKWNIQAPPMQRIQITILDLSLISLPNDRCLDLFEVKESRTIFATCHEQEPPTRIVSTGSSLEISLTAYESLVARRGIIFHYTAVGCPTPRPPGDGYFVYRNDTDAFYSCSIGYAFPDSLQRSKHLKCLGHVWNYNLPLPDCIDLVAPCVIIVALFVINAIILIALYQYKKRKTALYTEQELGTMPIHSNGNTA